MVEESVNSGMRVCGMVCTLMMGHQKLRGLKKIRSFSLSEYCVFMCFCVEFVYNHVFTAILTVFKDNRKRKKFSHTANSTPHQSFY